MTSTRGNDKLNTKELALVRAAMRRKKLTQHRLARACGFSRSAISQMLSGAIAPTTVTRERLADAIDLEVQPPVMKSARIIKRLRQ